MIVEIMVAEKRGDSQKSIMNQEANSRYEVGLYQGDSWPFSSNPLSPMCLQFLKVLKPSQTLQRAGGQVSKCMDLLEIFNFHITTNILYTHTYFQITAHSHSHPPSLPHPRERKQKSLKSKIH